MSLSVKHVNPPEGFNFVVKCTVQSTFTQYLAQDYDITKIYSSDLLNEYNYAIPFTEFYVFDDINVWIYNQEKQGYMYFYFQKKEDYLNLCNIMLQKRQNKLNKITNKVFRYLGNQSGWQMVDTFLSKKLEDLFGYDHYVKNILKDIDNHIKYNDFLNSIGEVRSINYLLYGPPGTGKTSLITSIATLKQYPVYIVNPNMIQGNNLKFLLSPPKRVESPIQILLFEDFDRYLENDNINDVMSQILNSLSGLDDNGKTIRFFTANSTEKIFNNHALVNRMSAKFKFDNPTIEIFRGKLMRLLSFYTAPDIEKTEHFLQLVENKNISTDVKITVRSFTNYVLRYLFEDNYLDKMIENISELN